jgi:hypothetical protein
MLLVLAALALGSLAWPQAGSAELEKTPTDLYLTAELTLLRNVLAAVPVAVKSAQARGAQIEAECTNVLAASPAASVLAANAPLPKQLRAQAEQLKELEDELSEAVDAATASSEQAAFNNLLQVLRTLHWRNRKLARATRTSIAVLERPTREIPDVCADMRSWVNSGYQALSPETKAFLAPTREQSSDASGLPPLVRAIVAKQGDRFERALVRHSATVANRIGDAYDPLTTITQKLETAVGLDASATGPPPAAVPIGRGTTVAGTKFLAKVTPAVKLCLPSVSITETDGPLVTSFGGETCTISTVVPAEQSVRCDVGLLKVQARVLPAARSVRLTLSNGQTVDSPVLLIPANVAGAPGGFYYQAVRGPSPIPVSLTELDAEGQTLTELPLRAVQRCAFR